MEASSSSEKSKRLRHRAMHFLVTFFLCVCMRARESGSVGSAGRCGGGGDCDSSSENGDGDEGSALGKVDWVVDGLRLGF